MEPIECKKGTFDSAEFAESDRELFVTDNYLRGRILVFDMDTLKFKRGWGAYGKPLKDIAGLPMIVQVMRRAEEAKIGRVVVATDTADIVAAVTRHGGEAVMTRDDHPSGSDRIHEALQQLDPNGEVE